jgi:hypothetical protein
VVHYIRNASPEVSNRRDLACSSLPVALRSVVRCSDMSGLEGQRAVPAAKFGAILPELDERQRRLLMGAKARSLGHGGIRAIARAAGVREATVSLGGRELDSGEAPLEGVRRADTRQGCAGIGCSRSPGSCTCQASWLSSSATSSTHIVRLHPTNSQFSPGRPGPPLMAGSYHLK